jgi:lantibiotic modifying enzyme
MVLKHEEEEIQSKPNTPTLNGINISLSNYLEPFINGFHNLYQFLVKHSESLLAIDSPLAVFSHQSVRFIWRTTGVYASVMSQSLHPKFLRNGCDRSIELDILSRALLLSESQHILWPLLRVEKCMMEKIDVPLFLACSDSNSLIIS